MEYTNGTMLQINHVQAAISWYSSTAIRRVLGLLSEIVESTHPCTTLEQVTVVGLRSAHIHKEDIAADYPALTTDDLEAIKEALNTN